MKKNNIEAIYSLSPMQEGMLFSAISRGGGAGYVLPLRFELRGQLNTAALRQSWQQVIDRHTILRTGFYWEGKDQPVQVVYKTSSPKWTEMDWRDISRLDQQSRLKRLLREEKERGFDLKKAPLMRMTLVQLGEEEYEFIWSLHHILMDGWSRPIVLKEVFAYYEAWRKGDNLRLEASRLYSDYIGWIRGRSKEKAERYWSELLKGFDTPTRLMAETNGKRWQINEVENEYEYLSVSEKVTKRLNEVSRRHQITLNTIVQCGWGILLSRYSGESDVVFGIVVSGRSADIAGIEKMVGIFINTLPVRIEVRLEETVKELLRRIQDQQVVSREYEYSHLVDVQKWSDVGREERLFDTIVSFQNFPIDNELKKHARSSEIASVERIGEAEDTEYGISLAVTARNTITFRLGYDPSRYEQTIIKRVLEGLRRILESIAADIDQRVSQIEILSNQERAQILYEWNDTQVACPGENCVHELFEEQAERTPDAIAVVYEGEQISYRALNRKANQLGHYLKAMGIGPEVLVGVCLERSIEMVVGLIGVWKAGAVYVAMDPSYPKQRLRWMIEDAAASVALTSGAAREALGADQVRVIDLEDEWGEVEKCGEWNPSGGVNGDNLAYVIYTSGSTGNPKGAMLTHAGIVNCIYWMQATYQLNEKDKFLMRTSLNFDPSVWELFWPLWLGGAVILADQQRNLEIAYLIQLIHECEVTSAYFIPSMLRAFLYEYRPGTCWSLKRVICGGESIPIETVNHFFDKLNAELHHSYGPTETSIAATEWTCERDSKHLIAPIGKPLGNIRVYILATRMQPAPMGIPGELYIGGICVGRGYLNHADLTAERFVPDSFSTDPGMRFYKTGDLARYLPDGNIEFCGRLDNQVKLRGYRIEPGEIEARLREHAALAEAVVMAREEAGEKRLVAYVVMKDGEESRACELREYMKERLPEYMVPWAYVKLERLPLTANGKADKRALPKPEAAGREMEESCQEPQTEVEEVMAEIWKQVLLVDRVGVEDNFFELGGDSILSIQVVSRFNQAGIKITPKQMFQHQTIAELARVAVKSVEINAEQLSVEGIVPLTPIQQSFFEREAPSRDHFNQSVMLRINQPIETDKMRLVVHRLVEHHDALRMRYEQGEKGWKQRNGAAEDNEIFSRIDLSDVGEEQYAKAIESNARQVQRSLSLSKGPLVRVVHYQSGDGTGRLLIVIHHLVVDGVSWRILLEDLQLGYEQVIKGEPIDFGKKTTSFKRWAEKLKEYANSEELRAELGYWGNLPEVEESRKGADKPGESYTTTSRRSINVRLSKEQTTSLLHEIGGVYHTQVNDLLLTGLARAVRKCGGKGRLVVEMEGHGREELFEGIDVSRTVGWFTSLYPVEIDIGREEKIGEQIKMVKEQLRKVPRNGIGYGLLRYLREGQEGQCLGNKRGEIRFNYLGQFDQVLVDEGRFSTARESKGGEVSDQIERDDLLEINGSVIGGRLEIAAGYTEETYTGESVERLAQCYREALEEIIAHCKSDDAGGYTPSDYPDSGLTQNILDQLIEEIGRVYD